jgi:hypothetical protein
VTDPDGDAWYDDCGYEADDKCAWSPAPFIGTGGYGYQWEWSNAARGCVKTRHNQSLIRFSEAPAQAGASFCPLSVYPSRESRVLRFAIRHL